MDMRGVACVAGILLVGGGGVTFSNDTNPCDLYAGYPDDPAIGVGVSFKDLDKDKAIPACKRAVDDFPDNLRFIFQLGRSFDKAGHFELAVSWYELAAEQGHALAQGNLGWMYEFGEGVEQDFAEAVKWYRLAAEQGEPVAQYRLGWMYEYGEGVTKDLAKAFSWYQRSARKGNESGQLALGWLYFYGEAVTQNFVKAVEWFRSSADQGDLDAQRALAICYLNGLGVQKDETKAYALMQSAAEQGSAEAQVWLGMALQDGVGVKRNLKEALEWYARAAEQGDDYAANNLGWAYQQGDGVEISYDKAAEWYERAAELNNLLALNNLGYLYQEGFGVIQSYEKAAELYKQAADLGELEAMLRLGRLYEDGSGVEQNALLALEWYNKAGEGSQNYELSTSDITTKSMALANARRLEAMIARSQDRPQHDFDYGSYYALVIGNDDYRELPPLRTAIRGATAIAEILQTEYSFDVTLVKNGTRQDILESLGHFRSILGADDNLLIYYAGHGFEDKVTEEGFWQPIGSNSTDSWNWIQNSTITTQLRGFKAKHVLIVADSCYSGSIFRGSEINRREETGYEWIEKVAKAKSRKALTSGALEPVWDGGGGGHSVFTKYFLEMLKKNKGIMTGEDLHNGLKPLVTNNSDQIPQYGLLIKAGDQGGDFVFLKTLVH